MIGLIIAIFRVYELIIIIRALLSWLNIRPEHSVIGFIIEVTEPLLSPIRRWTVFAGVDLSPIVVIVAIEIIISILRQLY